MKSFLRFLSLTSILLLFVVYGTLQAQSGAPIKIGFTVPLSAPGAVKAGLEMQFAAKLAEREVNDAGGVLGRPIELVFRDTRATPEEGTLQARRLIEEDGVVAIGGEFHSAAGLTIADVAHEKGIPVVFSETFNDKITGNGFREVFRIAPASTIASRSVIDWALSTNPKRVVVISENTDFGTGIAKKDVAFLEDAGVTVVENIFVELGTQDFTPIISRLQAIDPPVDIIFAKNVTGETSFNLESQITDSGLAPNETTIAVANQVAIQPEFFQNVPNGAYWAFPRSNILPSQYNDISQRVADGFQSVFNTNPPRWGFESFDTVKIIADAIERAGNTDPDAIIDALEDTDITLSQGRYFFKYTSKNPLPSDGSVESFFWHQWPNPAFLVIQFFENGQTAEQAAVLWPPAFQNFGTNLVPFGTKP